MYAHTHFSLLHTDFSLPYGTLTAQCCHRLHPPLSQPETERPLSSVSLFFQAQCLTKLVKLFKVPKLKSIKLTTEAETKETIRGKTHLFCRLFFTHNLHKTNLHHCSLLTACNQHIPKGASSSTSLCRSQPQMPLPQRTHYRAERLIPRRIIFCNRTKHREITIDREVVKEIWNHQQKRKTDGSYEAEDYSFCLQDCTK